MRDILEKLYLGRIRPCEKESTGEQSEILTRLTELEEELVQEPITFTANEAQSVFTSR